MSQTWDIPLLGNSTPAADRTKINSALEALRSSFSGSSSPGSPVAGQFFYDVDDQSIWVYNGTIFVKIIPSLTLDTAGLLFAAEAVLTADMSAGSFKITDLGAATEDGDAVRKSQVDSRSRLAVVRVGVLSASANILVFGGMVACEVLQASVLVDTTLAANGTNYWSFALKNMTEGGTPTLVSADTTAVGITANTTRDLGAISGTYADLAANDVLRLEVTKTGSPANLSEFVVLIRYKQDIA